jgi:ATP-GRASP peptide maturase of grasp-with-spasm system
MILILSESNDSTTSLVMEWLLATGKQIVRLNECDRMTGFTITNLSARLQFFQLSTQRVIDIDIAAVSMFWFRKQGFNLKQWLDKKFDDADIEKYIERELRIVADYVHYLLSQKPNLAMSFTSSMNKLLVNHLAAATGLQVPEYVVSASKGSFAAFLEQHNSRCITKAISESFFIQAGNQFVVSYTEPVAGGDLAAYDSDMMPSLLQKKIIKKYELRIFYLAGTCYASAIFSQNDRQTQTDFRKYNYSKPNRTVPFALPADVADRIDSLMLQLKLKTGSIDMLVSDKDEFIFLEVNPVGQFGMVSEPCNYFLEQKVAQFLAAAC